MRLALIQMLRVLVLLPFLIFFMLSSGFVFLVRIPFFERSGVRHAKEHSPPGGHYQSVVLRYTASVYLLIGVEVKCLYLFGSVNNLLGLELFLLIESVNKQFGGSMLLALPLFQLYNKIGQE